MHRRWLTGSLASIAFVLSACVSDGPTTPSRPPTHAGSSPPLVTFITPPPPTFSLSGYAVDALTGQPVANARLVASKESSTWTTWSATTDGSGHYVMAGVQTGVVHLMMFKDGYVMPCAYSIAIQQDVTQDFNILKNADLSASSSLPVPAGTRSISGVVYQPVDGAGVPGPPAPNVWIEGPWVETLTDSSGHYFICGLPTDSSLSLLADDNGFWSGFALFDPGGDVVRDIQLIECKGAVC